MTPKDGRSSLQMLAVAQAMAAHVRLDRTPFDALLGHARKTLSF